MNKPIELIKVFFDADVLIAGSASATGASFLLLQLCELGLLKGLTNNQVVVEFQRNIQKKLPQAELTFNEIIKNSIEIFQESSNCNYESYKNMADKKDLPILVSAILCETDYLITFNIKHYSPDSSISLVVTNPGTLLEKIRHQLIKMTEE